MNTHSQYRMTYTDLHNADGTATVNVYADVTMLGLAPVLKNPLCCYFFLEHMKCVVAGLRLSNPQAYDARPLAIRELKSLGYYGESAPAGLVAKFKFYMQFLRKV